ncbi:MAG: hypothetical protein Q8N34_03380 [Gammaproteobacteria bacterium]|nr:hypothetical protein [Gammaproteobacteria bacterium]
MTLGTEYPEHPILMGPAMIIAKRAGIKHMTRRTSGLSVINTALRDYDLVRLEHDRNNTAIGVFRNKRSGKELLIPCPFGGPGHSLWWREGWHTDKALDHLKPCELSPHHARIYYNGDYDRDLPAAAGRFRAPFHLPRWAARFVDPVESVTLERLQDITAEDAVLEGMMTHYGARGASYYNYLSDGEDNAWLSCPRQSFFSLWIMINGAEALVENPFVWAIKFKKAEQ